MKGMQLQYFTVSEKLKIKDKGHVGTYLTQAGREEFKKVQHLKQDNFIWYSDDDLVSSAANADDDDDDKMTGE